MIMITILIYYNNNNNRNDNNDTDNDDINNMIFTTKSNRISICHGISTMEIVQERLTPS